MWLTETDLLGDPAGINPRKPLPSLRRTADKFLPVSVEARRKKLVRYLETCGNYVLFDELFELLKCPILKSFEVPTEYSSDVNGVAVVEFDDDETESTLQIPYESWGTPWVVDEKGFNWSHESLLFLQARLFWRSVEELALNNNEQEKWSVLRWVFRPAIWKHYVFDKKRGKSLCLPVHERNDPFSYHNCCMSARMDEELVRQGIRRNIPVEIYKAVEDVCTFD